MMLDKGKKIFTGMAYIGSQLADGEGTFVLPLDADDLVSNRLAEFFNNRNEECCYLSKYGYIWNEGSRWLRKAKDLWRTCGSCSIIYYKKSELPLSVDSESEKEYLFSNSHRQIPTLAAKAGKRISTLPFASTIYVLGTGENHSTTYGVKLSWKRYVEAIINIPCYFSSQKRKEFIKS